MKYIGLSCFLFVALNVFGQLNTERQLNLEKIKFENASIQEIQNQKVIEYALKNKVPIFYTDEFRTTRMVGIDEFGLPVYVSTDNTNAAITTGVPALRLSGPLGLNLEGAGIRVAIWDGGKVGHVEFGNRIISTEGSAADAHSNHVTGTILATGIIPSAKGMAPKATMVAFDFNNDISEMASMARPDQTTILLSNHSYGFITGWDCSVNPCQWRGNSSISSQEDYRFGFYTNNAKSWDLIANNAPYYTIVKSAGNDRSSGAGANFPPDCNGGSGYDCIEEQATAKNILSIGAVSAVLNYVDSSSVKMSSFSGWGPTDDGRIKPDLVGDGVNVYSTVLNDLYGSLSGTSMSSPNVMGSLVLIQELHRNLNGGNFMLSSTVKALAIHTAKEAGISPGPDYSFGWGLLDVAAAANILVNKDDQNIIILERSLNNGEVFDLPLTPKANQKITATLAWNDPAGTPPLISVDPANLMLVNDLDMRIIDDQGNTQFPWALDPSNLALGNPAFKADNLRDNVEKIEFKNPEQRVYTLRISHKRTLAAAQMYSLVVTYSSVVDAPQKLYWVGNSGNWNDPAHWSAISGGPSSGSVPSSQNNVVFDENSFSSAGVVSLSNAAVCHSLLLLTSSEKIDFDLNANSLNLTGDLVSSDSTFSISSTGDVQFSGTALVNINKSDFSLGNFRFDGTSFKLRGRGKLGQVTLKKGSLDMSNTNFQIRNLNASTSGIKALNIKNAIISGIELSSLNVADNLSLQSDSVVINTPQASPAQFNWSGIILKGVLNIKPGMLTINGNNQIFRTILDGSLSLNGNIQFTNISLVAGSSIILSDNSIQTLSKNTTLQSTSIARINLQSSGHAKISFDGQYKLCFDFLNITGVALIGSASVNAGLNSTLVNAPDWMQENCQDVILPDFMISFPCSGGQTKFTDKSEGLISTYLWDFFNPSVVSSGINTNIATASYPTAATYQVRLTVSNNKFSKSLLRDVVIGTNDLNENSIVLNNLNLFSKEFAASYQWLKDNKPIQGATQRSYPFNGQTGAYTILTSSATCNKLSPVLVITGLTDDEPIHSGIDVYPNPARGLVTVRSKSAEEMNIRFLNLIGQSVGTYQVGPYSGTVDLSDIPGGVYIMVIEQGDMMYHRKLMIVK